MPHRHRGLVQLLAGIAYGVTLILCTLAAAPVGPALGGPGWVGVPASPGRDGARR